MASAIEAPPLGVTNPHGAVLPAGMPPRGATVDPVTKLEANNLENVKH